MYRYPNFATPGSMLKAPRIERRKTHRNARVRVHDDKHLALIRKCMCICCGMDPCGVAAHVRMSSAAHGKPMPGMQAKPDDKWTLPLCNDCHVRQGDEGELTFWYGVGISAVHWCVEIFKVTGNLEAMRAAVMRSFKER